MTLYFDYSTMLKWRGNPTGIPRTVDCLARALTALDPAVRLVAFDDDLRAFHHLAPAEDGFAVLGKVVFRAGDALVSAGANWAFARYNSAVRDAKNQGARFFQLFYDLIPALFPYYYEDGRGFGDYFGNWARETVALCDAAFAISECARRDVMEWCRLGAADAGRMAVIRLGDDFHRPRSDESAIERFSGMSGFVLCVGTLELRKNQLALLHAYRLLVRRGTILLPKLVLVGRQGWIDGNIAFQIDNDRALHDLVHVVTDATDNELAGLYQRCMFSVFPALYEGWGLPVAESLAHGKFCIASNAASIPEVGGDLVDYLDPLDIPAWADRLAWYFDHPVQLEERERIIASGYRLTKWEESAAQILGRVKNP